MCFFLVPEFRNVCSCTFKTFFAFEPFEMKSKSVARSIPRISRLQPAWVEVKYSECVFCLSSWGSVRRVCVHFACSACMQYRTTYPWCLQQAAPLARSLSFIIHRRTPRLWAAVPAAGGGGANAPMNVYHSVLSLVNYSSERRRILINVWSSLIEPHRAVGQDLRRRQWKIQVQAPHLSARTRPQTFA